MQEIKKRFHRLFGMGEQPINYAKPDFVDYVLMVLMSACAIRCAYGAASWLSFFGVGLCAFMVVSFVVRHSVASKLSLLPRREKWTEFKVDNSRHRRFLEVCEEHE